ncbi:hypothetical protein WJX82_001203 [Trebouxia sp. C0006]
MQHVSAEEKALQAKWVELAHDQALKSEAAGGIPIGSVLVHQPTRKVIAAGAILMYGIPAVIIAEHDNYLSPGEELLASKGVKVTVVNNHKCIQTMSSWIKEHPQLWHEDVAGNVNGARV